MRIEVKQMADGWWHWRILTDEHKELQHSNRTRRSRRAAIRSARRWLAYHERKNAEHWEAVT